MSVLTPAQANAIELLHRSHDSAPDTSDGIVSTETFYDREIHVAFIHWATARALRKKGLVEFGAWDPDEGTEIILP